MPVALGSRTHRASAMRDRPATRLTQSHKRLARSVVLSPSTLTLPVPEGVCRSCGKPIGRGRKNCADCAIAVSRENLVDVARFGRIAAQSQNAQICRAETQRRHEAGKRKWSPETLPAWLNHGNVCTENPASAHRVHQWCDSIGSWCFDAVRS